MSSQNDDQRRTGEDDLWIELERLIEHDDGAAARSHLEAGRWITYRDRNYPGFMVREWPNGKRELMQGDLHGNIIVLRTL
ncbi:hypothetical protein [Herbaspirillum rubrisubalbicans]|uniref:hypothetical protein n=1 Tax=Herbaspirillum TaxID=963 RepID=UPI001FC8EDE3|nr:hypothetical protein [Herbaspirillum rubrisubalbicans]